MRAGGNLEPLPRPAQGGVAGYVGDRSPDLEPWAEDQCDARTKLEADLLLDLDHTIAEGDSSRSIQTNLTVEHDLLRLKSGARSREQHRDTHQARNQSFAAHGGELHSTSGVSLSQSYGSDNYG